MVITTSDCRFSRLDRDAYHQNCQGSTLSVMLEPVADNTQQSSRSTLQFIENPYLLWLRLKNDATKVLSVTFPRESPCYILGPESHGISDFRVTGQFLNVLYNQVSLFLWDNKAFSAIGEEIANPLASWNNKSTTLSGGFKSWQAKPNVRSNLEEYSCLRIKIKKFRLVNRTSNFYPTFQT